jgi:hypothetical protein
MSQYRAATSEFVQNAKGVIGPVDMLKMALAGGDTSDIEFATDVLARAADSYAGNTAKYERFGFDEIAATPDSALPKRERVVSDLLASALVDLQVANTLIVAGRAAKETPELTSLADLETTTDQMNSLINLIALPLGKAVDVPAERARFGFDEVPSPAPAGASQDLATAKANFEKSHTEVLKVLVTETKNVLQAAFKGVADLDEQKMAEAIGMLGQTAGQLPRIGTLITKGLTLAVQALQKLSKLLGSENVETLRQKAQEILAQIKAGGDLLDQFLTSSYGVAKAQEHVRTRLNETSAAIGQIDRGTKRFADLQTRFAEQMALLTRIVNGLNTGKRFVGFLLPPVAAVLLFGTFYLVAMNYAVFAGIDFADSTKLLNWVKGVITITEETLA